MLVKEKRQLERVGDGGLLWFQDKLPGDDWCSETNLDVWLNSHCSSRTYLKHFPHFTGDEIL